MNKNPELAKRFLRAWVKGLDWAINNQKAAVDNMRKRVPEINEKEATANFAEIVRISQSPDSRPRAGLARPGGMGEARGVHARPA